MVVLGGETVSFERGSHVGGDDWERIFSAMVGVPHGPILPSLPTDTQRGRRCSRSLASRRGTLTGLATPRLKHQRTRCHWVVPSAFLWILLSMLCTYMPCHGRSSPWSHSTLTAHRHPDEATVLRSSASRRATLTGLPTSRMSPFLSMFPGPLSAYVGQR